MLMVVISAMTMELEVIFVYLIIATLDIILILILKNVLKTHAQKKSKCSQ